MLRQLILALAVIAGAYYCAVMLAFRLTYPELTSVQALLSTPDVLRMNFDAAAARWGQP